MFESRDNRIFVFGFLHAIVNTTFLSRTGFGPGFETVAIARSLATTGRFADPYAPVPTGFTAHSAPLYPAFLALPLWFHSVSAMAITAILANAVAFGILISLLPPLSARLWGSGYLSEGQQRGRQSVCLLSA
jgi:hypothetical protein